ncbi:DUF3891 family protein [Mucilaginibacter celer]|uniref:DUF3891 family protein n=1 Tax=Mucilaginibacter celer TaxID=2305508 RepID=A0A494VW48_9SPHI|nr:DUF3891 family protein [Mucilaginibacter celer]AYL95212.1 DUF3891 family protein [Mucilaginibacter celer]
MIVNYTKNGWEVITQRAHGMLAAQLASHWHHSVRTERWLETLLAIAEHDDARVEPGDDELLTHQGGPADFKMKTYNQGHCQRTFEASISKSRYVALLCSMHLDFVYGSLCKNNAEDQSFMKAQEALRRGWRKELHITIKQAEKDYRLMEWCDALSLLICQRENQPEGRAVEISKGPDNGNYLLTQDEPGILKITPWPFEEKEFKVAFETRLINQLTFKNNDEFRKAFYAAGVIEKSWIIKH